MKIYGPYTRKDGRKHIIKRDPLTKKTQTVSYPRYLMEQHLGRELLDDETVDHINGDFTDDRIENLQLLSRVDNAKKAMIGREAEILDFLCPICGAEFSIPARQYRHNQLKKGNRGPYCSKSCANKATR